MKPRFRLLARGDAWYALPINDAAMALKVPAYQLFIPMEGLKTKTEPEQ